MNILSLILSNFCKESFYEDGEILFFGLIFSPNFINLSFVDTKMIFSSPQQEELKLKFLLDIKIGSLRRDGS